jgi:hypothetical protein
VLQITFISFTHSSVQLWMIRQVVISAGAGPFLVLSPAISLGIEIGGRYALSDKIDGFSSDFSHSNDIHYFLNIFIIFKRRSEDTMMYHRR